MGRGVSTSVILSAVLSVTAVVRADLASSLSVVSSSVSIAAFAPQTVLTSAAHPPHPDDSVVLPWGPVSPVAPAAAFEPVRLGCWTTAAPTGARSLLVRENRARMPDERIEPLPPGPGSDALALTGLLGVGAVSVLWSARNWSPGGLPAWCQRNEACCDDWAGMPHVSRSSVGPLAASVGLSVSCHRLHSRMLLVRHRGGCAWECQWQYPSQPPRGPPAFPQSYNDARSLPYR